MNNKEADNCSQPSACEQATPIASNSVRARKTTKKTTTKQRKTNKCGVCKKMMRGECLKRHLIAKHSTIPNSNRVKKVVWDARPYKDYHKSTACSACGKVMRDDNIKRHTIAKHKDVLSTVGAVKKQSISNRKTSFSA